MSNSGLLRRVSTPPWNEEGVQLHLNLNRHGYIKRLINKTPYLAVGLTDLIQVGAYSIVRY